MPYCSALAVPMCTDISRSDSQITGVVITSCDDLFPAALPRSFSVTTKCATIIMVAEVEIGRGQVTVQRAIECRVVHANVTQVGNVREKKQRAWAELDPRASVAMRSGHQPRLFCAVRPV